MSLSLSLLSHSFYIYIYMRMHNNYTHEHNLSSMVLLVEKLGRSLKFPTDKTDLGDFRSKISVLVAGVLLRADPESELMSLAGFNKCFEVISTSNAAFAKLAVEIDYPMREWGAAVTEEYLSCTLQILDLVNSVTASLSLLTQAKMSNLHALTIINTSPPSSARRLNNITREKLKFERRRSCSRHERVILEALILSNKIGLLALGFVVSGLSGDAKPYLEMRKALGVDDSLLKDLDSRFYKELMGLQGIVMEEVKEVNMATAAVLSSGRSSQAMEEWKRRSKVLENSINGIEKQADNLFSQVLNARNKLLANIRLPE